MGCPILTKSECESIVRAWKADAKYGDLKDIHPDAEWGYFPYIARVRVFLATRNVLATNALWDGNPNLAYVLLRKHGLKDNRQVRNRDYATSNNLITKNRLESAAWRNHKERSTSAWGVCKGPALKRAR